MALEPVSRIGPLFLPAHGGDVKDPCPVFDGNRWHIYGSVGSSMVEQWEVLHMVAPNIEGPWERAPVILKGVQGPHVAAPSVVFDAGTFHMFLQTDFMALDTRIVHLASGDGETFQRLDTALESIPLTTEAGIYDPHAADIDGKKYMTYSGCTEVSRPDIYLAESESGSWNGPWKRHGRILCHEDVPHHNQHGYQDYEWGLEGSQVLRLPGGIHLLNAVCFLPETPRGRRQRVFLAVASGLKGPYRTLGPILEPRIEGDWESGENGHAMAIFDDGMLRLFYQARSADEKNRPWRHGVATFRVADIEREAERVLRGGESIGV